MLKYQIAIIEQHLKQDPHAELFPTVYPILFFQGRHNKLYPYSLDLLDLFGDRDFAAATFAKPAFLVDLNKFSDQEIMHKHNLIALVEYMQKHSRDRDLMLIIEQLKQMILMISKRLGADQNLLEFYLKCNLYYIMQVGKISDPQAFMQELATVPIIQGEIMGSIARELKAIGKAEGIAEGQAKGIIKGIIEGKKQTAISMQRKGLDLKLISEITNLTIEEINKLKEENFKK